MDINLLGNVQLSTTNHILVLEKLRKYENLLEYLENKKNNNISNEDEKKNKVILLKEIKDKIIINMNSDNNLVDKRNNITNNRGLTRHIRTDFFTLEERLVKMRMKLINHKNMERIKNEKKKKVN
eukprot:GHVL01000086.1.p2 GENE.GHVL01000086.1~~GHVL01000086.1.p2  ORF type:complete len:125 (+),score=52.92 GHVL01000086.1:44-418(+)